MCFTPYLTQLSDLMLISDSNTPAWEPETYAFKKNKRLVSYQKNGNSYTIDRQNKASIPSFHQLYRPIQRAMIGMPPLEARGYRPYLVREWPNMGTDVPGEATLD